MASVLMTPVLCEICSFTPAKFYCNTCRIALCRTCILQHLMSPGSTHHHIVLYSEKLNRKYLANLSCDAHLNKLPEFWCQTCGVPSCVSCITDKHKGHHCSYITIMLSRKRDEMVEEMKNLRETMVNEWEDVLKQAQAITAKYIDDIEKIEKDLEAHAKEMHKQVDIILSKSQESLQQMKMADLDKLQEQEKYLSDRLKKEVQRFEDQIRDTDPYVLLQFKKGTQQIKPPSLKTVSGPVFTPGQIDTEFLEQMFGQLSRLLRDNTSVQYQFSVDTSIPRIACVEQGLAWVATENKLQLMDRSGSVKDKIKIDFDIKDMALTSDGDLLLADYWGRCIKSVSQRRKMSTLFSTSGTPWGLCCLHNDDLVVAFYYDRGVIIYSRDGEIRQTLDNIDFRCPWKVAVNKINQDICVCDEDKLIAVEANGKLRYEYTGQGDSEFRPVDVCTDQMGHVLIIDRHNDRIHILDQEGRFIHYILTAEQGLYQPGTMDVDKEGYVWVREWDGSIKVAKYLQ